MRIPHALFSILLLAACQNELDTTESAFADDADEIAEHAHADGDPEDPFGVSEEELAAQQSLEQGLNAARCDQNAHTGDYCGTDKVSNGARHTLYHCNGPGPATVRQACAGECVIAPAGQDDFCRAVAPTCDGNARTGEYCGGDKVSHGVSSTLYHCNGPGRATVVQQCANGCAVAPAGADDFCRPAAPRCDSDAHDGLYCGGDKVSHASSSTLYRCDGPGAAAVERVCADGCVVAPAGSDDHCRASDAGGDCAHRSLLRWGLAPRASDGLRCAGFTADRITQTIGNAAASAGTHAQDGTIDGDPYCAATDLSTRNRTDAQVRAILNDLADQGFVPFFRNPGHDGWPSGEARHIHAIYVGARMKSALRAQVNDFLAGRNGLASHGRYTFWQPSSAQRDHIRALFNEFN